MLHTEKSGIPTVFGQDMRQRTDTRAVLPTMVRETDQSVALRIAAGEQRPS